MSVINMYCDEQPWGEVFPGIYLVRLRNVVADPEWQYVAGNDVAAHEGAFGLTICNDPFLIFSQEPRLCSSFEVDEDEFFEGMSDAQWEALNAETDHFLSLEKELTGCFEDMGQLWESIRAAGWEQRKHGFATIFIQHKVAEYIKAHTPNRRRWRKRIGRE